MKEKLSNSKRELVITGVVVLIVALFAYVVARPSLRSTQAPASAQIEIRLGEESAKNQMVTYTDPLCDRCHEFMSETLSDLVENEVASGSLSVVVRPLSISSSYSADINELTVCADRQGKFLETSLALGELIHSADDNKIIDVRAKELLEGDPAKALADKIDINQSKLNDCLDDNEFAPLFAVQDDEAEDKGIYSTPTSFVNNHDPIRGHSKVGFIRAQLEP